SISPRRSPHTPTLFPYTTLFRSADPGRPDGPAAPAPPWSGIHTPTGSPACAAPRATGTGSSWSGVGRADAPRASRSGFRVTLHAAGHPRPPAEGATIKPAPSAAQADPGGVLRGGIRLAAVLVVFPGRPVHERGDRGWGERGGELHAPDLPGRVHRP